MSMPLPWMQARSRVIAAALLGSGSQRPTRACPRPRQRAIAVAPAVASTDVHHRVVAAASNRRHARLAVHGVVLPRHGAAHLDRLRSTAPVVVRSLDVLGERAGGGGSDAQ